MLLIAESCFVVQEQDEILYCDGDINKRYSPSSTFQIPLSIIGFDFGILINEEHPIWKFQEGYDSWNEEWKQDQSPKNWIKNGCIWYSERLIKQLKKEIFQEYITRFDYGNQDISGNTENFSRSWLSSTLKISAIEQIIFLNKMLNNDLQVSDESITITKRMIFIQDMPNGWKLYGKKGMGLLFGQDEDKIYGVQHGWFIGWMQKHDKKILFANHISDAKKEKIFASIRAQEYAIKKLQNIIT